MILLSNKDSYKDDFKQITNYIEKGYNIVCIVS